MRAWLAQVRKGLVELCIMATLRKGEAYGYELLQALSNAEGLAITESTVYPILSRLAREGWVRVRAAPSPAGPPRRYYRLTPLGLARLRQMEEYWKDIQESTNALIEGGIE
jgi:PadR family transcriptional regulator PadR